MADPRCLLCEGDPASGSHHARGCPNADAADFDDAPPRYGFSEFDYDDDDEASAGPCPLCGAAERDACVRGCPNAWVP